MLSPSLTKLLRILGFIGTEERAHVVTTRAREARYYVSDWQTLRHYKPDKSVSGYEVMFQVLQDMLHNDEGFVVSPGSNVLLPLR